MRINQPVTTTEFMFAERDTLVSVTDTKGRITYCNPAFVYVSGFVHEELLGQPHNLIRHPDMPAEAFRDLWDTIVAGLPWAGLVKNRRKNGDFYWVQANITPLRDGTQVTGFLSVRTLPTREQVQAADALYAQMRAEAQTGHTVHTLHRGTVQRQNFAGRLVRLLRPSTTVRLGLVQVIPVALAVLPASLGAPWWVTGGVALLAIAASALAARALAIAPLKELVHDANQLASGDLTHVVHTGASGSVGELQRALFQLSVNLRTVVGDVRQEIEHLETAVQEIASGNNDLSARTETQASSLEQTAASMEWSRSTARCKTVPHPPAGAHALRKKPPTSPSAATTPCWPWARPCRALPNRRGTSKTSCSSSKAWPFRPTSSRSMRPWRPHAQARPGAALPWWPPRCAPWPHAPRSRRATSNA